MTVQRQIGFWIAALAVAVLLLFVLRGILLPFVAGFALAYLLDPLADRLQKVGIGRLGSSLLILVLFVLVLIISLMILVPFAAQQVAAFVERLPGYVTRLQELGTEQLGPLIRKLRSITNKTVNKEPKWRHNKPELTTGYDPRFRP